MATTDETIDAIRKGDIHTFETLFTSNYSELYAIGYRYVLDQAQAEDLIQEVFLTIWEKRTQLQIQTSFRAYLLMAVKNRALSHLRSAYHLQVTSIPPDEIPSNAQSVPTEIDNQQLKQLVQKGIQNLPKRCRLIFQLSRNAGLTYDEIAQELGVSKETVKSQIKIAMQKLRAFLGEHWELVLALGILAQV